MSRLDELISELCPDGVVHISLGKIAKAENGRNKDRHCEIAYSITQRGLIPTSDYFGDTKITSDDTSNYKIVKRGWFVYSPSRIDVGSINYLRDKEEVIVSPLNVVFSVDESIIRQDYLLYFLSTKDGTWQILTKREGIEGTGRKLLPFDRFATIIVPVPPMKVQEEICSMLSQFSGYVDALTAELTARQKQYEYYTKKLFFDLENARSVLLGSIATIRTGTKPSVIREGKAQYEYINAGTSNSGFTDGYNCEGDVVTTPSRGQGGIGFVGYQKKKFWLGPLCYRIKSKDNVVLANKYLYYYLSCHKEKILQYKKEGGTPAVNASDLSIIEVILPTIDKQQMIIAILDRFEALCNDISNGLPAEITARQKQYEYYRDRLLTFKKLNF